MVGAAIGRPQSLLSSRSHCEAPMEPWQSHKEEQYPKAPFGKGSCRRSRLRDCINGADTCVTRPTIIHKAGTELTRNRKKLKPYKINRGTFEEQKLREDKKTETQRALLFILPVLMLAVLAVGIFFGYKSYEKSAAEEKTIESGAAPTEAPTSDPMLLTVVSPAYPIDADYVPALVDFNGVKVSPDMTDDLQRMLSDAEAAGHPLKVTEGYISYKEQKERYDSAVQEYLKKSKMTLVKAESQVKRTTPREGESEQQTGLLVRFDDEEKGAFADGETLKWLRRNAVNYGFILRYPESENVGGLAYTPNLFRYVGVENAYNIRAYNMSFDQYALYTAFQ